MIKTIEIENFQSHKLTTLNLSSGVNVIKGRSHGGKSSIIRALKWSLLNQPRGDSFVSHFKEKNDRTAVGIEFDNDSFVIRKKEGTINGYDLPRTNLAAIRSDLPDEVSAITNINDVNIQTQDQHFYMLDLSSGKVAQKLNSLVGLDIIDETITKLNKIQNENTTRKYLLEEDISKVNEALEELDFIDDLEERVVTIEKLLEQKLQLQQRMSEIRSSMEEVVECKNAIKENEEWLKIKKPFDKINSLLRDRVSLRGDLMQLENTIDDMSQCKIVQERSAQKVGALLLKRQSIQNSEEYQKLFCGQCGAHISHWRKK